MTKLKEYKMYINGAWVDAENKKTFKSLNPENNEPWAIVPEASANDVNKAVEAAQKAFEGKWPKLMPRERANYLKLIANQLRDNAEMLGKIETIDTGKLFRETKTQANYIDDDNILKKINVNTLVSTGQYDVGSTPEMSKNLSKMILRSEFVEIKGGKHLCGMECSNDVNILLKKFIDKNNDETQRI